MNDRDGGRALTGRCAGRDYLETEFFLAALLALRSSDASVPLAVGSEPSTPGSLEQLGGKNMRGPAGVQIPPPSFLMASWRSSA